MIMETKIEKFFKESNVIEDLSGDYVVITMPKSTYHQLKCTLLDASFNGLDKQRALRLIMLLDKAYEKGKGTWF